MASHRAEIQLRPNGCGQIFQLTPTGNGNANIKVLHQFNAARWSHSSDRQPRVEERCALRLDGNRRLFKSRNHFQAGSVTADDKAAQRDGGAAFFLPW